MLRLLLLTVMNYSTNPPAPRRTVKPSTKAVRALTIEHHQDGIGSKLRLKGGWLAQAGFLPGEGATVEIHNGMLLIRADSFLSESLTTPKI